MSPCIALPPFQQLLRALINRTTGSAQTRQLFVKVEICWSSVLLKVLRPSAQLGNSYQAAVVMVFAILLGAFPLDETHEDSLEAWGLSIPEWVPTVPATWPWRTIYNPVKPQVYGWDCWYAGWNLIREAWKIEEMTAQVCKNHSLWGCFSPLVDRKWLICSSCWYRLPWLSFSVFRFG